VEYRADKSDVTGTGYVSASRGVPVYSPGFAGTRQAIHGRIASLSRHGRLVPQRDGLPALRWLCILALTGPGVMQLF